MSNKEEYVELMKMELDAHVIVSLIKEELDGWLRYKMMGMDDLAKDEMKHAKALFKMLSNKKKED